MKPTAAKTVSVQLIHRNHMPRSATYLLSLLFAVAATCAQADTYDIVSRGSSSSHVSFSDSANWTVDGAAATTYPQSEDAIRFGTGNTTYKAYIDLDGDYTIQYFTQGFNIPYLYKSESAAADTVSLTITGKIGGGAYQYYYANANTKLIFPVGSILRGATSDANESRVYVENGGEVDVLGAVSSRHIKWYVAEGGVLRMEPTSYVETGDTGAINDKFYLNGGTALFPNGFAVTGGNSSWANEFNHNSGIASFGGDFTSASSAWTYIWNGGTIAATADCTIGSGVSLVIPDSKSVTIDVSSGATFTVPASASIGSSVTLAKVGVGDVRFASATLPDTLNVNVGGLVLGVAGVYDLSGVAFASGTYLKLSASGTTLSAFDSSIANATFAVADGYVPASGATVFTCSDATVLAQAQTGLNASLAGTGITVGVSGTSLVAESHYTFTSSSVTDLNDTTGWVNNLAAPAGQPAVVSGSSTAAVMDETVPAYSAITVESGASLTVNATRNLPAATFEAGTTLAVASSAGSVVMESQSHSGYIMDTDTLVGTISPSQGISEITDIAGYVGGGWLGSRDTL